MTPSSQERVPTSQVLVSLQQQLRVTTEKVQWSIQASAATPFADKTDMLRQSGICLDIFRLSLTKWEVSDTTQTFQCTHRHFPTVQINKCRLAVWTTFMRLSVGQICLSCCMWRFSLNVRRHCAHHQTLEHVFWHCRMSADIMGRFLTCTDCLQTLQTFSDTNKNVVSDSSFF